MHGPMHRPGRRRLLLLLPAAALLLAGCGLGSGQRRDFFLLRDAAAPDTAPPAARIDRVLLVSAMAMPGLYDSDRMVFSGDGLSRSYFQFGNWSERPAQSLQTHAEARLARGARFREVVSSTSGVRGDLLLSLRLDELYLDTAQQPGRVTLSVSAELIDWRDRRLLARRAFVQTATVAQVGAAGLAEAASQAMGRLLGELAAWVVSSAAAAPSTG
jgi:cholesterol transport system auxiliary component